MNYNISIIIPHKNIPKLLERCLNSIPEREDIQIIIVDDNSDEKYKNNFPGLARANTKVFFSDKSLTAGGARNLGLSNAEGRFVMFADADDFFYTHFYKIVAPFFDNDFDLVYFGMDSVDSVSLKPATRANGIIKLLKKASEGDIKSQEEVRYKFLYPSCKLIKRELINAHQIKFDEVPASNDTMFGVKIGTFAENIIFSPKVIYCLTYRENSLVTSYNYENLKSRILVSLDLYKFLEERGKQLYSQSTISHWFALRKVGYDKLLLNVPLLIKKYKWKAFLQDVKFAVFHRLKIIYK